ncbi:MAG: helix-hairpin-helix domain-containing protein [bacterium]|nr:helix-hairpin-helix domain-containing protein [bacterium]
MKIKKQTLIQFIAYGVLFIAVVITGTFLERYTSDKIQVETIAVDDTENDPLYSEKSSAEEVIDDKININTASADLLDTLDGIGKATAQKIIDYREKNGPFASTEAIMDVSGIGVKKYDTIKDKICVQ